MSAAAIEVRRHGREAYPQTHAFQLGRVAELASGAPGAREAVVFVEHEPVVTLGRRPDAAGNVLDAGALPVVPVERGGDATWHGPGQLVCYPLLRLEGPERDLHAYLRALEAWVIEIVGRFGLEAGTRPGLTGVWAGDRKIASIGVAVKRWVTYHGWALNVAPELRDFARLNPCGLDAAVMTSLARELGGAGPGLEAVLEAAIATGPAHLGRAFAASEPPAGYMKLR